MTDLRILGGSAKGRTLKVPATARPTPVRIRKSLFDMLEHGWPRGATLLDLYAGAGAVGLEAASRGLDVTLVEQNAQAVRLLEQNRIAARVAAKVVRADARSFLRAPPKSFDVVFIDPPYTQDLFEVARLALCAPNLLRVGGWLMLQTPVQVRLPEDAGFELERRVYGSNVLHVYTRLEETSA